MGGESCWQATTLASDQGFREQLCAIRPALLGAFTETAAKSKLKGAEAPREIKDPSGGQEVATSGRVCSRAGVEKERQSWEAEATAVHAAP